MRGEGAPVLSSSGRVWTGTETRVNPGSSARLPSRVSEQTGFYADPTVYDILHAPGTADEARGVEVVARRLLGTDGPFVFLEPACGTARHLRQLARCGHRGVGFDLSGDMIDDARDRAHRAGLRDRLELFVGDMTRFASSVRARCDVAFNLINTLRHLPDDDAVLAHLSEVRACLKKRGLYVVGISTTVYGVEQPTEDVWPSARGRCRVTQVVNYLPPEEPGSRTETVLSHLHIERPSGDEHRDSVYTLRTYSLEEWRDLIDRSPFEIVDVADDMGAPVTPPRLGYALFTLRPR